MEGARRFPANPIFARAQIEFAAGTGNYALADSLAHSFVAGNPSTPLVHQALVDAALERTPEVLDHLHALRQSQLSSGSVPGSFLTLLMMARLRLHGAGDTTAAVNEIESALRRREFSAIDLRERPYAVLAHFFVEAGRYARGREWASATPPSQFPGVIRRHRP